MKFLAVVQRSRKGILEVLDGKLVRPLSKEDLVKLCKVPFVAAYNVLSEADECNLLTPMGAFHKYSREEYSMVIPNKGRTVVPAKHKIKFSLCRTASKK